jgi:hypothetical protein
VIRHER